MIKETKARCWVHGIRTRVFSDPGSCGAAFRFPVGDGAEWGSIFVDLDRPWGTVFGYIMHELFEYNCAASDFRYSSTESNDSTSALFVLTHDQMSRVVEDSSNAWLNMKGPLKKAWRKHQKEMAE